MRAARVFGLVTLLCAGCGPDLFSTNPHNPALAPYYAYGDSITYGLGLASATQNYTNLVAENYRYTLTNSGIPGAQACDVAPTQIFANSDNPSLATTSLHTVLIGTNDVLHKGVGAYETVFNLCDQALLAWLALPAEYKVLATAGSVTTSGTGQLDTPPWQEWISNAQGASIRFPISLAAAGPAYVWYRIWDGNTGTFSYALDGATVGSVVSGTNPTMSTVNGSTSSMALLRIPSIPAGSHILTFTQTSTGASDMGIVAVGSLPPPGTPGLPRVLVGTLTLQLQGNTGYPCSQTQAPCLEYDSDITANVAQLVADGLYVQIFESAKYMTGTTADMADDVHLNALGHEEVFHSIQDMLQ